MDFQQIRDFVNPAVAQATGLQEVENLSMPVPVAYVPVQLVIDGALSLTSENPVQNKVIAVAIQNLDGRITAIEGQFSEGVTEAVNNWLAAHPEATTTVQDGAITYAKLDSNLKGEVDQISDLKRTFESYEGGTTGQVLRKRSNADNDVEWASVGQPTDEQTAEAVSNWLDDHPEATTTVQDHSLTYQKLVNGTLGFVTPEMFGAKGDGETDDTSAVQHALNSGKIVIFNTCTYLITDVLTYNHSADLVGNGAILYFSVKRGTLLRITGNDFTINGLTFKGTGEGFADEPAEGAGILLHALGNNITIYNCNFIDANYVGLLSEFNTQSVFAINCKFDNCWAEGFAMWGDYGKSDKCTYTNCSYNGLVVRGKIGATITNCKFIDCASAQDCALVVTYDHQRTNMPKNIKIENCDISGAGIGISIGALDGDTNCNNVVISKCIIHDGTAVQDNSIGVRLLCVDNAIISDCVFDKAGALNYDLLFSNGNNAIVENCIFTDNSGVLSHIQSTCTKMLISNNQFGSALNGIRLMGSGTQWIHDYKVDGNLFNGTTTGIDINNNYIRTGSITNNSFNNVSTPLSSVAKAASFETYGNIPTLSLAGFSTISNVMPLNNDMRVVTNSNPATYNLPNGIYILSLKRAGGWSVNACFIISVRAGSEIVVTPLFKEGSFDSFCTITNTTNDITITCSNTFSGDLISSIISMG